MSLVVRMSLAMHSYQPIGNFVEVGYFLRVIAVAVVEAESRLLVAVHTDLESG